MKFWIFAGNSLVLSFCIVGSVLAGFGIVRAFFSPEQLSFQTPIAVIIAIGLFQLWIWLQTRFARLHRLEPKNRKELLIAYLISFFWTPIILVPLQYLVQGTTVTLSNITVMWWFQFPVGLVAILMAGYLFRVPGTPTRRLFRK